MGLDETDRAIGAEKMREMELGRRRLVAGHFLEAGPVILGIFAGKERRQAVIAAQFEDAALGLLVGDHRDALRVDLHRLREIGIAILRAVIVHHAQPGRAGELEEAGRAAFIRVNVAAKATFDTGLGDQEIEVDTGFGRRLADAGQHLWR